MDIYIKPVKKTAITARKLVYVKDVAEVFSGDYSVDAIKNIVVFKVKNNQPKNYCISVMDIIRAIHNTFPNSTVNNVGEMDIIIQYSPEKQKTNRYIEYLKIAAIFVVLFAGAMTAIMSFHTDGEMPDILKNYYYIFFRETMENPPIMVIPYSIGLGVGIIIFFNHFSRMYITKDPTPIEVQMTTYENETIANIVDTLQRDNEGGEKS